MLMRCLSVVSSCSCVVRFLWFGVIRLTWFDFSHFVAIFFLSSCAYFIWFFVHFCWQLFYSVANLSLFFFPPSRVMADLLCCVLLDGWSIFFGFIIWVTCFIFILFYDLYFHCVFMLSLLFIGNWRKLLVGFWLTVHFVNIFHTFLCHTFVYFWKYYTFPKTVFSLFIPIFFHTSFSLSFIIFIWFFLIFPLFVSNYTVLSFVI